MLSSTMLYLMTAPEQVPGASRHALPIAHMAYRVGNGPHLLRAHLPAPVFGGIMVLDNQGFDGRGGPDSFCKEVLQECVSHHFTGVFCDFEGSCLALLGKIISQLSTLLSHRGWTLYLPEEYAHYAPNGRVVIPTAISGGCLAHRLEEAVARYGAQRVVVGLERSAEDFCLPAAAGSGISLTQEELRLRIDQRAPAIYFSDELCAHYFTYMTRGENAHFILYDDAASLRKKIQIARSLDIMEGFLLYPQVHDILSAILA